MYDHLIVIQKIVIAIYALTSLHAFFYSWWHRKRITIGSAETTIIPLVIILLLTAKLQFPYTANSLLVIVGLLLFLFGNILVKKAWPHLSWNNSDDFWFGRHEAKERTLVTTGPYAYIRHPIFVGLVLTYLGLVLLFLHPISISIFFVTLIFGIYTEFQEEKFMLNRFPEYLEYMKRTGMFIPKLSLKKGILVLFFISIIALHFVANATGLYQTRVIWFDNVLHFLTGVAFGLSWLWLFRGTRKGAFIFVAILAVTWELLEFGFLKMFPIYAHSLSIFSPNLSEALADVFSNLLGVIVLMMFLRFKILSK